MASDGITVVMPTLGRVGTVRKALNALRDARRLLPPDVGYEFFMVDDSPEPEGSQLRELCDPVQSETYLWGPRIVGAKRNFGARAGKYSTILFLDSDCISEPSLLVDHLAMLDRAEKSGATAAGAVTGATVPDGEADTWFWKAAEFSLIFNAPNLWALEYHEVPWAPGDNLSMRRAIFDEIGGFDEHPYTVVGGEDVDICMRLRDEGYVIRCIRKALVRHSREPISGMGDIAKKLFLYGRTSVYNAARQPHHQDLHANRVTISAALLALGAARGQRRTMTAAALAAGGLFLADAGRLMRRRGRWAPELALPAIFLEWTFDAGICREALRRGRPRCLLTRFRYFDESGFRRDDPL